jgi:hypothetical protein
MIEMVMMVLIMILFLLLLLFSRKFRLTKRHGGAARARMPASATANSSKPR